MEDWLQIDESDIQSMFKVLLKGSEYQKELSNIENWEEIAYYTYKRIEELRIVNNVAKELQVLHSVCKQYIEVYSKIIGEITEIVLDENIVPKLLREEFSEDGIIALVNSNNEDIFNYTLKITNYLLAKDAVSAQDLFEQYIMYVELTIEELLTNKYKLLACEVVDHTEEKLTETNFNAQGLLDCIFEYVFEAEDKNELILKALTNKNKWLISA